MLSGVGGRSRIATEQPDHVRRLAFRVVAREVDRANPLSQQPTRLAVDGGAEPGTWIELIGPRGCAADPRSRRGSVVCVHAPVLSSVGHMIHGLNLFTRQ